MLELHQASIASRLIAGIEMLEHVGILIRRGASTSTRTSSRASA
ncbi:MAG: hypothetical protein R3F43_23140 [bacterium]